MLLQIVRISSIFHTQFPHRSLLNYDWMAKLIYPTTITTRHSNYVKQKEYISISFHLLVCLCVSNRYLIITLLRNRCHRQIKGGNQSIDVCTHNRKMLVNNIPWYKGDGMKRRVEFLSLITVSWITTKIHSCQVVTLQRLLRINQNENQNHPEDHSFSSYLLCPVFTDLQLFATIRRWRWWWWCFWGMPILNITKLHQDRDEQHPNFSDHAMDARESLAITLNSWLVW